MTQMQYHAMSSGGKYRVIEEMTEKNMKEIRIPGMNCDEVLPYLKPVTFKLEQAVITI